ncbi:hypothetical protein BDN72DRAFT_8440 [Pluteus cervinus]|uniref:Uncharacterized protein n=1 Tax=Pluteus cervinus TaxID=181527 RepID=A0ACD3BGH6_9AGAR|nr:hypothetical protein BDN72DRAFT_8440 [Pluteus cervinus]
MTYDDIVSLLARPFWMDVTSFGCTDSIFPGTDIVYIATYVFLRLLIRSIPRLWTHHMMLRPSFSVWLRRRRRYDVLFSFLHSFRFRFPVAGFSFYSTYIYFFLFLSLFPLCAVISNLEGISASYHVH